VLPSAPAEEEKSARTIQMSISRKNPDSPSDSLRGDPDADASAEQSPADDAAMGIEQANERAGNEDRADQPEMSGEEEPILQFRESRRQRPRARREPLD
jgi:hypothetical protein